MGASAKGTQGPSNLCIWTAGSEDPGLVGHCPGQGKVGGLTISPTAAQVGRRGWSRCTGGRTGRAVPLPCSQLRGGTSLSSTGLALSLKSQPRWQPRQVCCGSGAATGPDAEGPWGDPPATHLPLLPRLLGRPAGSEGFPGSGRPLPQPLPVCAHGHALPWDRGQALIRGPALAFL